MFGRVVSWGYQFGSDYSIPHQTDALNCVSKLVRGIKLETLKNHQLYQETCGFHWHLIAPNTEQIIRCNKLEKYALLNLFNTNLDGVFSDHLTQPKELW